MSKSLSHKILIDIKVLIKYIFINFCIYSLGFKHTLYVSHHIWHCRCRKSLPFVPLGFRAFPIYVWMSGCPFIPIPMSGCPPIYQYSILERPSLIPFITISCLILQLCLSVDLKVSGCGNQVLSNFISQAFSNVCQRNPWVFICVKQKHLSLSKGELVQWEVPIFQCTYMNILW